MHVVRLSGPSAPVAVAAQRRRIARPVPQRTAGVYRRRRLVAAAVATVSLLGMVQVATTVVAGGASVAATDALAAPRATVVVQPGDTLWELAHRHRGAADHTWYVDALIRLNGSASIQAGQVIVLP